MRFKYIPLIYLVISFLMIVIYGILIYRDITDRSLNKLSKVFEVIGLITTPYILAYIAYWVTNHVRII